MSSTFPYSASPFFPTYPTLGTDGTTTANKPFVIPWWVWLLIALSVLSIFLLA
jgi:hypothetical protein